MKFYNRFYAPVASVALALGVFVAMTALVNAQGAGVDLGGGAGMFRPKNPETKSKRRTVKTVKSTTTPGARTTRGGGGSKPSAEEIAAAAERAEDALDEGNEARDARRYQDAERAYRDALKFKPRDARAAYGLGNVYTDQQRWDEAERSYRQAVSFDPNDADAWVALSYVLIQPTSSGNNARRLADAEMAARRAILIQPNYAAAFDRLGSALEARGLSNSDTEQAYRRAVELDSQSAVAHVHLARLLRKMNRASEADPFYKRAAELAQDAPTLILIADALQSEQRWDDSEPLLKRALAMDGRNPNALFLMGRMLVVKKRYIEAEPLLKTVIEVSPRSFSPYNILGSAYLRMDRYQDAESVYNRASEFASVGDRKILAGNFGLGGVGDGYMKAGRAADALRAYQKALTLDPGNAELERKIADARGQINR